MDYRTDRHNNMIAISNGKAEWINLLKKKEIPFELGDPFGGRFKTIKFPDIPTGQEACRFLLSESDALQGWYKNHTGQEVCQKFQVFNNNQFKLVNRWVQNEILNGIYEKEVGDGRLKIENMIELIRSLGYSKDMTTNGGKVKKGQGAGGFYFQKANTNLIQKIPVKTKGEKGMITWLSRAMACKNEHQEHIDKNYKHVDDLF